MVFKPFKLDDVREARSDLGIADIVCFPVTQLLKRVLKIGDSLDVFPPSPRSWAFRSWRW